MDWLLARQERIEKKLAARHLSEVSTSPRTETDQPRITGSSSIKASIRIVPLNQEQVSESTSHISLTCP
jgi:hypothetical protein